MKKRTSTKPSALDILLSHGVWQRNWCLDILPRWRDTGRLFLNAPYQRETVWNEQRQRNFILSILMGLPIPSVIANDRHAADFKDQKNNAEGYTIIDGKQRITAILKFWDSKLAVPRHWFKPDDIFASHMAAHIVFSELTTAAQRRFGNKGFAVTETSLRTLEQEQAVFELVNFGGVPQGQSDLTPCSLSDDSSVECATCGGEDRNVCRCPQDCEKCHTGMYLTYPDTEWPAGSILCQSCATERIHQLEHVLRGIMTSFAPVASWYLPEGEEHDLQYYPDAVAAAVTDFISDREENVQNRANHPKKEL